MQSFSKWFAQTQKFSSFGKGSVRWMFCIHLYRRNLFSALAAGILWKLDPGLFFGSSYSQTQRRLQPWWLFGRWLLCSVLQVVISYPYITSHILHGKCDFVSSVSGNKLGKYTFWGFLKNTYIANGRKIKVSSTKKYVKVLSSG